MVFSEAAAARLSNVRSFDSQRKVVGNKSFSGATSEKSCSQRRIIRNIACLSVLAVLVMAMVATNFVLEKAENAHHRPTRHGRLDLHPDNLVRCATFRVRGWDVASKAAGNERGPGLSAKDAARHFLRESRRRRTTTPAGPMTISLGIEFVETWNGPDAFVSFQMTHMHYFHFLEMLVIAFSEITFMKRHLHSVSSTRAKGSADTIDVQLAAEWMYHPYMTPKEICGPGGGINCLVFMYLFAPHLAESISPSGGDVMSTAMEVAHGLESNDQAMIDHDSVCGGDRTAWPGSPTSWKPGPPEEQNQRHAQLEQSVDAVLLVDRAACNQDDSTNINKIWMGYLDSFPALDWHNSLQSTFQYMNNHSWYYQQGKDTLMNVCYMDRQSWGRALPDDFHQWLVEFFDSDQRIQFYHLHMENHSPQEQIQIASSCHIMMGAHGNALSHQFWMQPGSYVMEFFWHFSFKFDYATIAELMRHHYLALCNGAPVDSKAIGRHDPALLSCSDLSLNDEEKLVNDVQQGKNAILRFVDHAHGKWMMKQKEHMAMHERSWL